MSDRSKEDVVRKGDDELFFFCIMESIICVLIFDYLGFCCCFNKIYCLKNLMMLVNFNICKVFSNLIIVLLNIVSMINI